MNQADPQHRWWHGAALYQLYVRSWRDSDGDGYGDLRGVIGRLDHLSWLGVDGIWLSPTMPSPDADWGYDVSDYTGVHPGLGTLADLDELIGAARERGLAVLLDLVPNHTSSAHPWFVEARTGRDAAHRDYYVWADPAPGGGPPNNWLDATGQSAWAFDDRTGQFYLHNFLVGQPDLNWWQPAVHREFREILEFWFGRGVAGFRIDVAHGLYKDADLRDNPPDDIGSPLTGQFGLRPVYSANRPQVHGVYRDWRKVADAYDPPRLLLGETWTGDADRMAAFYGDDDELQLAFNFPFVFADFDAGQLAGVVDRTLAALPAGACPAWMASNHDVGRFPSRWCGGDERKTRLALLVLATLPGAVVLYYGDEIGMTDVAVPPELQRDEMTLSGPAPAGGGAGSSDEHAGPGDSASATGGGGNRDRARTPMPWEAGPGGGFTDAAMPWLPLGDTGGGRNVADQRADPGSVLALCRELLALRRSAMGGQIAGYRRLSGPGPLWAYACGELLVLANFGDEPATWAGERGVILLRTTAAPAGPPGAGQTAELAARQAAGGAPDTGDGPGIVVLGPWQGLIARRSG
jgi:alpha-glucosidase